MLVTEFTLAIAANLATDLLKFGAGNLLDYTQLGARLKAKFGLVDSKLEKEFYTVLQNAYYMYFAAKYPDRQYGVFYEFFASYEVSKIIFDNIFNFIPIDEARLEELLENRLGNDWILFQILEKKNLAMGVIVHDFLDCYFEVEKNSTDLRTLFVVREIRDSESRIIDSISKNLEAKSEHVIASLTDQMRIHLELLGALLTEKGIDTSQTKILDLVHEDVNSFEMFFHEAMIRFSPLYATADFASKIASGEAKWDELQEFSKDLSLCANMV